MRFYSVIFMLLSGCASGPLFEEIPASDNHAIVYVYRPYKFSGGFGSPDVYVDGKKEFSLDSGAYRPVVLKPGQHKVQIKEKVWGDVDETLKFAVRAGETYFLRFELFKTAADQSAAIGLIGIGGASIGSSSNKDQKNKPSFIDERVMDKKVF